LFKTEEWGKRMASILHSQANRERHIEAFLIVLFFALHSLVLKRSVWMLTGALCWFRAISTWFHLQSLDADINGLKRYFNEKCGLFWEEKNGVTV
jgi:hypothetical protein